MYAQAYDNPIPGYGTKNVANLRLFEATPVTEFDLDAFNEGQYEKAILQVGEDAAECSRGVTGMNTRTADSNQGDIVIKGKSVAELCLDFPAGIIM